VKMDKLGRYLERGLYERAIQIQLPVKRKTTVRELLKIV